MDLAVCSGGSFASAESPSDVAADERFPGIAHCVIFALLPLLIWCLSLCRPSFSCRMAALLYLPTIIFGLGAVQPFDFRWEFRLPLAVLSVLSALVAVDLSRRHSRAVSLQ